MNKTLTALVIPVIAVSALEEAIAHDSERWKETVKTAHTLRQSGDYEGAIKVYEAYKTLFPEDPYVYGSLGAHFFSWAKIESSKKQEFLEKSVQSYTKAIELAERKRKEYTETEFVHIQGINLSGRGLAYQSKGELELAKKDFISALKLYSNPAFEEQKKKTEERLHSISIKQ